MELVSCGNPLCSGLLHDFPVADFAVTFLVCTRENSFV
jgi:hypothetical protein